MSQEELIQITENLRAKIRAGNSNVSFEQLENYVQSNLPELRNDVTLYTSRHNRLNRVLRQGTITWDQFQVEQTRLEDEILQFLEELPKQISNNSISKNQIAPEPAEITLHENNSLEQIISAGNLKDISWIQQGLQASDSVCRILTPGGMATGFLISPNLIMTCNHVIPEKAMADQSYAEFNYQKDISGKTLFSYRYRLLSEPFHTSPFTDLDYTIVGIEPNPDLPPLEKWGYLRHDSNYRPVPFEHVAIVQHPEGGPKQISLTANQVVKLDPPRMYYAVDTSAGSTGAPVFNGAWQVMALHHAKKILEDKKGKDRFIGEGILMSEIKNHAGNLWPA